MRRWVIVGGVAFAAAASIAVAVVAVSSPAVVEVVASSNVSYVERMESCVSAESAYVEKALANGEAYCFAQALADATRSGKLPDVLPALYSLDEIAPTLCHGPAHIAGAMVMSDPARWPEFVDLVNSKVCTGGLLHGALEQIAFLGWSLDEWGPLTQWCSTAAELDPDPECAHAVGHAAWDTYRDRKDAGRVCEYFDSSLLRSYCAEGVVMQEFSPPARPDQSRSVMDTSGNIEACSHLDVTELPAVREGCLKGVGFALYRELEGLLWMGRHDLTVESLREEVSRAAQPCAQFGSEADVCASEFFFMVSFALRNSIPAEELCPGVKDFEQVCFAQDMEAARSMGTFDPNGAPDAWPSPAPPVAAVS